MLRFFLQLIWKLWANSSDPIQEFFSLGIELLRDEAAVFLNQDF